MNSGQIVQRLVPWRFRLLARGMTSITSNTKSVRFDFGKKTIAIEIHQTVLPQSFTDALHFAQIAAFTVEALDGTADGVLFGIRPLGLKLESHQFDLDYAAAGNKVAVHEYLFTYDDLITGEPVQGEPAAHDGDPRFPTPAEAVAALEEPEVLELDLEQEMRITPDNPDTDGDGVPDKLDKHPKDPKRH